MDYEMIGKGLGTGNTMVNNPSPNTEFPQKSKLINQIRVLPLEGCVMY